MLPAAPGRLSTTTGWPHASVICGPIRRARMSEPPPGANGVRIRIGWLGYPSCACAIPVPTAATSAAATRRATRALGMISVVHRAPRPARRHDELAVDRPGPVGGEKHRDVGDLGRIDHA